ncbi:MAG: glycoside hydrolase family 5 protein [Planctomycetia bacterium]|jgi:endoglucanase
MKMRFGLIVLIVLLIASGMSCPCEADTPNPFSRWGVNLAGGGFGVHRSDFFNRKPGQYQKDYIYPGQATMDYFASNGLGLFRIPFRWERIQPRLGKPLDANELKRLKAVVRRAAEADAQVILDLHNYARYRTRKDGKTVERIVGDPRDPAADRVTVEHLCDLWRRLAREFQNNSAVVGYGIMNEPHDMPKTGPTWHKISQAVVRAIRAVDPETTILVPGDRWSSARWFPKANGPTAWIDPEVPNIVYEAHLYFDHDGSGKYRLDYDVCLAKDPLLAKRGLEYVKPFLDWCARNRVQGFIGEFGVPSDPRWLAIMDDFLRETSKAGVGGCYWAAGPWWGNYPLSIQPDKKTWEHAPQMKVLKRHVSDGRQ